MDKQKAYFVIFVISFLLSGNGMAEETKPVLSLLSTVKFGAPYQALSYKSTLQDELIVRINLNIVLSLRSKGKSKFNH